MLKLRDGVYLLSISLVASDKLRITVGSYAHPTAIKKGGNNGNPGI